MKYMLLLLMLLVGCTRVPPAAAPVNPESAPDGRTRVGNGGDDNALRDNAWFLGEASIRVCLEANEGEPSALERTAIEDAFGVWQRYLSEKKLNEPGQYPERAAIPAARSLQARYEWVACSQKPDLRIVIGKTADAQLNWERLNEFAGKSAFVMRRSYDVDTGRGRGDIWISSSRDAAFQTETGQALWLTGHVVHELGHVLGCGHVPDTIMAEDFIKVVEASPAQVYPASFSEEKRRTDAYWPDTKRELLTCLGCPVTVTRGWTHTQWDVFAALFGSDAVNEISPSYDLDLTKLGADQPFELKFSARQTAGWGTTIFLENEKLEEVTRGDLPLFKVTYREGQALQSHASFQTSLRYSGVVRGHGDEGQTFSIPLVITRNTEEGAMTLSLPDRREPWVKGTRVGAPLIPEKKNE